MYSVHVPYVHVSTGQMVYVHVHVGDQKLKWMKHTSLYTIALVSLMSLALWLECPFAECISINRERGQV